jgi:hybrid cluster-associated redox disulfide protein
MKITKDTSLFELSTSPEAAEIMMDIGLHCLGCSASRFETVGQGCRGHGMSDKEINELVEKLNKVVKE